LKRVFDLAVSLPLLMFLMPVVILVSVLIKIDSKGPVFFKQERVGRFGRVFNLYKFRSMVIDAANNGPYFTQENDLRITKAGRILRATSIDELPQILNVIKGEMSLVGPRPDLLVQRANYTKEEWNKRCLVRPGITGLAQARFRSQATAGQRTKLDLEYVDKASLEFDLKIIFLTIEQLLLKKNGN